MKKIKHNLDGLPSNKYFYLSMVLFFLVSCQQSGDIQQIKNYFREVHHYTMGNGNQTIIILSDNGCIHCNKTFSENEKKYIENKKVVFLITADENYLDLSQYLNKSNVFLDDRKMLTDYGIKDQSSFIVIKNNKIDTIVHIEFDKVLNQVDLLDKTISNL